MNPVWLILFPGGTNRCLTMSYDDGREHDRRLIEIFNRYGIKGTFHLNAYSVEKEGFIPGSEYRTLYAGHEVSSHMATHPYPVDLPASNVVKQVIDDRVALEQASGQIVRGMSYPFGNYNDSVIASCRAAGMEYARTCVSTGKFAVPEDFMRWHPTCHHKESIIDRIEPFLTNNRFSRMKIFYVWGHSYEFGDDKWDLIESFCDKIGGRDDVWYATNIEIVDYINAVRGLRFSSELTMVYNPSALDVWFLYQGDTVCVGAGQTMTLA